MKWEKKPHSGGYYWMKYPTTYDSVPIGWGREMVKVYYCSPDDWRYVRFSESHTAVDLNGRYLRDSELEFYGPLPYPEIT